MYLDELRNLKCSCDLFATFDLVFAEFLLRSTGSTSAELFVTGALLCRQLRNGQHICDLSKFAGQKLLLNDNTTITLPDLSDWHQKLVAQTAAVTDPQTNEAKPVLLDGYKVSLRKYYNLYKELFKRFSEINKLPQTSLLPEDFADKPPYSLQDLAVYTGLNRRLLILTGGPGTGKTTVTGRIIKALLHHDPNEKIVAAAPTGKAQQRLKEQFCADAENLPDTSPARQALLTMNCATIDSLLCNRESNAALLSCTTLILDECSMLSLEKFAALFKQLSERPLLPRLILIGDPMQLQSIGCGGIFADLCALGDANVAPADSRISFDSRCRPAGGIKEFDGAIVELLDNYRSKNAPEICRIAEAVRNTCDDELPALAHEISKLHTPDFFCRKVSVDEYKTLLAEILHKKDESGFCFADLPSLAARSDADSMEKALRIADSFKILCCVNNGQSGITGLNAAMCELLGISSDLRQPGAVIMITENDPFSKLHNGDTGVVFLDPQGRLFVKFKNIQHDFSFHELPPFQCGFAITVHKSQGSGYANVLLILPEYESPLLSRKLLYTGITRAAGSVEIWAEEKNLLFALKTEA